MLELQERRTFLKRLQVQKSNSSADSEDEAEACLSPAECDCTN